MSIWIFPEKNPTAEEFFRDIDERNRFESAFTKLRVSDLTNEFRLAEEKHKQQLEQQANLSRALENQASGEPSRLADLSQLCAEKHPCCENLISTIRGIFGRIDEFDQRLNESNRYVQNEFRKLVPDNVRSRVQQEGDIPIGNEIFQWNVPGLSLQTAAAKVDTSEALKALFEAVFGDTFFKDYAFEGPVHLPNGPHYPLQTAFDQLFGMFKLEHCELALH